MHVLISILYIKKDPGKKLGSDLKLYAKTSR